MAACRDELAVVACSALKQKYRDVLSGRARGQQHFHDVAFVSVSVHAAWSPACVTLLWSCLLLIVSELLVQAFHYQAQSNVQPAVQVLLQPNKETLVKRVQERSALGLHFMPASLLESQLALLEFDPAAYTYGTPLTFTLTLLHQVRCTMRCFKQQVVF